MGKSAYDGMVKQSKQQHEQEVQSILADYNSGALRVPCVVLQCIAYSDQFLLDLVRPQDGEITGEIASLGKRKRKVRDPSNPASVPSSNPQRSRLT